MVSVLTCLMKYLNGQYYVESKDHRYRNHPTENVI